MDEEDCVPANEFIEDINVLLYLIDLCRLLGVEDGEGGYGSTVIDVTTSWLEEATDEDDFEEGICIFEEFKGGACLYELCCVGFEVAFLDCFEVFIELVSEDCGV